MSNSSDTIDASLKEFLLKSDEQYRELATEHLKYDERLSELSCLSHPNEQELLEETILKKKKLFLKDQMETIAARFRSSAVAH